jgi:signal-transduction protein with cAMP-binding, CBS, and nucleotidyltransferase domain
MTKNLKWRLGKLPSVEEIQSLVKDKIITNEEAREILFSSQTEEEKDIKSLEAKINFLKEIIESLSRGVSYREVIRGVPIYYKKYDWYYPTETWLCNTGTFNEYQELAEA